MTDQLEGDTGGSSPEAPPAPGVLPIYMMPEDVLQRWSALPANQPITVQITKQDLDNLFFSIANVHNALDTTNRSFVGWSNGQIIQAQAGLEESRRAIVAGMNCLRYFFEAVISRVVGPSGNG